ncbi:MAG: DUF4843 domain-containing protein, partial [Odoribacter sp.]
MKKYLFLMFISLSVCSISCDQRETMLYDDEPEIYFEKFYMNAIAPGTEQRDSTLTSFFFYPDGTQDIKASLLVLLSGKFLDTDLHYGLKVVEELTTANPDEYTIDPSYTFRAKVGNVKQVKDTLRILMHRSDRLASLPNGVRLVVELVPNETVGLGQAERIRANIILTTKVIKPIWWTREVEESLLGVYSEKKYKKKQKKKKKKKQKKHKKKKKKKHNFIKKV